MDLSGPIRRMRPPRTLAPRAERWRRASVFPTKAGTFDCNPKNVETYNLNSTS
jgi:hypothetical protein